MIIQELNIDDLCEQPKESLLSLSYVDHEQRPFVLICPGGGYSHLAFEKEGLKVQDWLQGEKFHTGILSYSVKEIKPTKFLNELEEVMAYLRNQSQISKIFVLGFSAGAHVTGLIGTKNQLKPDGLLLSYPVVSFSEDYSHDGSWQNFLGEGVDLATRANFSIEKNITEKTPPCFIWHTADDSAVPVANSLFLTQALNEAGVSVELHVFPEGPHGISILEEYPHVIQWKTLAINWLLQQIKN